MDKERSACSCQSGQNYDDCCAPLHQGAAAADAERLMRSRYSAYVLQKIDYIVATTVPAQQHLLDKRDLLNWSRNTQWLGLDVLRHLPGKQHAQVEFAAHFAEAGEARVHHELSAFVRIDGRWYFIDPTVPLPTMKQPCFCGSDKKFKACCGQFFK
ncbi:YchJ family protein [Bergeriella denitrificans]|uniref:UPF0225 protein NCTC10295_00482 n=1 Tax=Bergeriella denitrificans TaxID=494 RepID=A0A378UGU4_BERDE|nr:YchJ family protein [Bergeriella denitrificans]STZ75731.1 SEC-C domain-containing protein [Bergeriella denitrificans]